VAVAATPALTTVVVPGHAGVAAATLTTAVVEQRHGASTERESEQAHRDQLGRVVADEPPGGCASARPRLRLRLRFRLWLGQGRRFGLALRRLPRLERLRRLRLGRLLLGRLLLGRLLGLRMLWGRILRVGHRLSCCARARTARAHDQDAPLSCVDA
jgi:hypothetical protein